MLAATYITMQNVTHVVLYRIYFLVLKYDTYLKGEKEEVVAKRYVHGSNQKSLFRVLLDLVQPAVNNGHSRPRSLQVLNFDNDGFTVSVLQSPEHPATLSFLICFRITLKSHWRASEP